MKIADLTYDDYLLAYKNGISRYNLQNRIKIGWDLERAKTEPVNHKVSKKYKEEVKE